MKDVKVELYHDNFQNYKRYNIPRANLVLADIPYNLGKNAYASSTEWYIDGDNKKGESKKAGKQFFNTDSNFNIAEFMHFCNNLLIKEPKERNKAPAMIVFCAFEQMQMIIKYGKQYGFKNSYPLFFIKNYSSQVLKANMRVVGAMEYAVVLYRDKLPKFNNNGKMIFNYMDWHRDNDTPKIHPCLPKGEKVFINDKWMNIEDAKVGDWSRYGKVIETTKHEAETNVEIKVDKDAVNATHNHPFLIKRGGEILWLEAEKILKGDYLLMNLKQLIKDILESEEMAKQECSISLSGRQKKDLCQKVINYIIRMEIKQIIELKTLSLSTPLHISGCTQIAKLEMENGTNLAKLVDNIRSALKNIGITAEDGSMAENAKSATNKDKLEKSVFVGRKVNDIKVSNKKQTVYNLTIEGIPAFDTKVGVSHNTQKPIPVLKRLIEIFTDEGDVVIDPVAGSGTTLKAAAEMNRHAYGFEVFREFYDKANKYILNSIQLSFTLNQMDMVGVVDE